MEQVKGSPSTDNDASNMKEFLLVLGDIQSIDIDKLRAQLLQSSESVSQNEAEDLVQKTNHTLEALKRETNRVKKRLEEEQKLRKEYFSAFGKRKIFDLHKMMEDLKGVRENLREETQRLKEKNRNLVEEKRKALEEKSDALTRLSKQMGNQMTNNNPNIADLSDQNRPSKLGERYAELYDNQWTNAFEVLTKTRGQEEERAIEILLNLLVECNNFAKTAAEKQMDDLLTLVSCDPHMQLGDEIKSHMRKARKLMDVTRADLLFQKCERHIKDKSESARQDLYQKEMKQYLIECFQICWLMAIQDPPVVLGKEVNYADNFDTNMYKHYTRSGKRFNFVVWPPLLLHEGGPLLAKGTAQPIQENTDAVATLKTKKYRHAWEDRVTTGISEKPIKDTLKHDHVQLSLMTTISIKNDLRVNTHRPETTTFSPSSLATTSNLCLMTTVNRQLSTDHSRNTGARNGKDLFSSSYRQSNDRVYSGVHSTISSTLGTSPSYAVESENKSALSQRDNVLYTGGASQSYARSSRTQSMQSQESLSSHTSSTSSSYANDMTSKRHDFLVKLANETGGHLSLTGQQRSRPEQFHERVAAHSYEPLKKHEQSEFDLFINRYNREGEWVTRKYFPKQYDRYLALFHKLKQTDAGRKRANKMV